MVRHIAPIILCLLVVQVIADSDAIRRRRRGVLEVMDHQESASEILASLWEKDGISPHQRDLAKKGGKGGKKDHMKGGKGQMKGDDMSFYYF